MSQRKDMIERELEEYERSKNDATYPITLRGKRTYIPVIRVNPDFLLLNHKNNRLSGQLQDHPRRHHVEAEPWGVESQQLLHSLLAKTAKFSDLVKQLKEMGQQEPGLITNEGLLVNGNTRVAALRELKTGYVDVAVLPGNITEEDVLDMEMSLQVTELVHQDYTFTNQLLLMRRFLDAGNTAEALAKKMAWVVGGVKKVNMHMRLLSYIDEVRELSPIPYSSFDSKSQHLKDLDNDYVRLKESGDIDAAESLKWSRLTMIFLGLNKDQVRAIDETFVEKDLMPRLDKGAEDAKEYLETHRNAFEEDELDDLLGEQASESVNMKGVLKDFLTSDKNKDDMGIPTADRDSLFNKIAFKGRRAAESIIDEHKLETANAEPSESLKEAKVKVASIRQKLPFLIRDSRFKAKQFAFDLDELVRELEMLKSQLSDHEEL